MDALTIEAVEAAVAAGYPEGRGCRADRRARRPGGAGRRGVRPRSRRSAVEAGAFELHAAETAEERARIWRGRKSLVRGDGPDLVELLRPGRRRARAPGCRRCSGARRELADEYGLRVASVFHAGDGNLHPLVLYDEAVEGEPERAEQLATAILDACIDAGGSLTGEHGVGVDKACSMPKLFSRARPRGDAAPSRRHSIPPASRTPARSFRPRVSAGRFRARTARTRWNGQALPSVSEPATLEEAAEALGGSGTVSIDRDGGDTRLSTASLNRLLEHEPGDLTAIVEAGHPPLRAAGIPRRARADARARPARRPDDRSVPRRRSLGAAPAPLRRHARSRDRRHPRAPRRPDRQLGRQGREERRRLRPREALLRLARAASA